MEVIMEIENKDTLLNALNSKINLFTGAGFSLLASNVEEQSMPKGADLAKELCDKFGKKYSEKNDLAKLYTVISSTHNEQLQDFLRKRFTIKNFDLRYKVLDKLSIDTIFTTNIDNLLQKIFEGSKSKYLNDLNFHGPVLYDKSAIDLISLHGSVLNPNKPLRFGKTEIASSFENDPTTWRDLQNRLNRSSILFWGYSVEDPGTLQALAESVSKKSGDKKHWIIAHPSTSSEDIEYYKALNFQIVISDTSEFLDFLNTEFYDEKKSHAIKLSSDAKSLFPNETIPSVSELTTFNPIENFFRGSAPQWSDIYSPVLYKTDYFSKIREAIYAKKQIILTGVPASGKTTLLMQLAASLEFKGYKLMISDITHERAESIIRRLGNEPALIFVDNFTDDAAAFENLASRKNIQAVGADRDYNVNNALHLFDKRKFQRFDITDLSRSDQQNLRQSIPAPLQQPEFRLPQTTNKTQPSIFELMDVNIVGPTLKDRVRKAIRELEDDSPLVAEMLLFISYVHHCGTPVSMDMAIGYWQDNKSILYENIYPMIKRIGASIIEYEGELAFEPQDYFSARSTLVADEVLNAVSNDSMKRMLTRFYKNLSKYSICYYDKFSRRAYENSLILKAFKSWEEGKVFYDNLYKKDPSPYVLQHAALYLSKSNRHKEAFYYIERAKAEAGIFNWTIKNSYAIILFKANIEGKDRASKDALSDSMSTLIECYKSDRRKVFHARIFAENAVQYWEKYRDTPAKNYLSQALDWLDEVKEKEIWPRDLEYTRRTIINYLDK